MPRNAKLVLYFVLAVATILSSRIHAQNNDDRLKAYNTEECIAFRQIERPPSGFTFRRFKQEDTGKFHRLHHQCEASVEAL